jgi:ATP-dependent Lhr-like helicase
VSGTNYRFSVPDLSNEGNVTQTVDAKNNATSFSYDRLNRRTQMTEPGSFNTTTSLWQLVWAGEVTNDTWAPLRSLCRAATPSARRAARGRRTFRSRRLAKTPASEGRWSLLVRSNDSQPTATERQTAVATQLIQRYGILTREMVASENVPGGFAGLYPVLKAMEEAGRIRRGYFVAGLGAAQFGAPGADERLREPPAADPAEERPTFVLAATDPANPFGAALAWPGNDEVAARPQRAAGAQVVIHEGRLIGYLSRTGQSLITFLPDEEPGRAAMRDVLVQTLSELAVPGAPVFLTKIDGQEPGATDLAPSLIAAGFTGTSRGYLKRG